MIPMLTAQERDRFAAWLEQEAQTAQGLATQAEQLPHMAELVRRLRLESGASLIVAKKLRQIEDVTL